MPEETEWQAQWEARQPWRTWQGGPLPSGPPPVWSAHPIVAGAAALFVGTALAFEVYGFAQIAAESPVPPEGVGRMLFVLPFLSCFGVPFALLGNLLVVLPLVWVARRAGSRLTGRDTWRWIPAVAVPPAVAVTVLAGIFLKPGPGDLALVWLTAQSLLTGAALYARDAALHGGRILRVLGYGAMAAVAVFGVGGIAYGAGLLTEYSPPKVTAAQLAGTWSDGHGGTLRLSPDGTARAEGLRFRCSGTGTWSYEPDGPTAWDQLVLTEFEECSPDWRISGRPGHPKLNRDYGDADDPHWYTLTR
ncbi:hypothetical protein K388_01130 [Streptomyces sp. KhCrAH-43]|nr:hypothetical protein K388_01130 [Streptomyces sp. KhCrAH-43]